MKKIIKTLCVFIFLLIPIFLCSCSATVDNKEIDFVRFKRISSYSNDGNFIRIYVDVETKVMYMFCKSGYAGGLTAMLDENGLPLLYEGEL